MLTPAERDRFATWLEYEAETDEQMARQAESLGPAHKPIVSKIRVEAMAASIVAKKLRSIESETIGG